MHSPTRQRFLEKKTQARKQRKRMEGMVVCRGMIDSRTGKSPCEYALFPRKDTIDSVITCHRCHTGHIKSVTGWKTFEEEEARKGRM